jgi:hypothetical protein
METTKAIPTRGAINPSTNRKVFVAKQIRKGGRFNAATPIVADFKQTSQVKWVDINLLHVDHTYQRPIDLPRVRTMARNWDQDRCGVLVVNQRIDGSWFIIDGQQRHAALMLIENHPPQILVEAFSGLDPTEEAKLFYELDTKRRGLTTAAIFHALVAANDPAALEIVETAHNAGLTVDSKRNAPNNIRAFGTIMAIHRRSGKYVLGRVFDVVSKAWPDSKYWGAGSILAGLEAFFVQYPQAKDAHLIEALAKTSPATIEHHAHSLNEALSGARAKWVAKVIVGLYNNGMRKNRLPTTD